MANKDLVIFREDGVVPEIEWMANQLPGGFIIYEVQEPQEILFFNNTVLKMYGFENEEEFSQFTGNCFRGLVYKDDYESVYKNIKEQTAGNKEHLDHVQFRIQRKDGEIRWVDDYGHRIGTYKYGEVACVFVTDITDEKNSREENKRLSDQRSMALDALRNETDAITVIYEMLGSGKWSIDFDEKGQMSSVKWSDQLRNMIGYKNETDFPNVLESWSDLLHPEDKENVLKSFRETIDDYTGKKIYDVKYRLLTKNSGYRWYRSIGKPTRRPDGTPKTYMGLFTDIDDKVKMDEELQIRGMELEVALKEAQAASHAKSSFLSNMSHDIRTPMNAIIGFTDMALLNTDNKELMEEYLSNIKASSEHLLSLINDVLEMSRIESGRIELNEAPVNLSDVLRNLATIIIGQVEGKNQELFMDAIDVKDENVICDKLRLNQVLLNLVSNAIKYTPTGGRVSIRILQKSLPVDGFADYEIRVKDNGMGMSEEFAGKIFEAFERENTSTISGIQGTGLGMSITKKIIDLMGGTIDLITEKDKGSEFIVKFSLKVVFGEKRNYKIPKLAGVHALVVDDDYDTCDSTTKLLADMELRAEWTLSGKEAVLRAGQAMQRNDPFGIYIIDWRLPDLSGVEVARRIREKLGKDVPILLMTAYDWLAIRGEAEAAGVNGFCNKPVFASELHDALIRVVEGHETVDENQETENDRADFTGRRVLLVDDIQINRKIATKILELYGFDVEIACDGEEAVEKFENAAESYYDVILMDIQMPKMNGYEATKAIRNLPEGKGEKIPILAMTANAFDEDRNNALEAGMDGHIAKPIDQKILTEMLAKVIK